MTTKLPTSYQEFIHVSRYSKWIEKEGRRETWPETVQRYVNFFRNEHEGSKVLREDDALWKELEAAILGTETMPSMRCLMTAGPALARENISGYNCAYVAIDGIRTFSEILYILMNGTGVGFSVERKYVDNLPALPGKFVKARDVYSDFKPIVVADTKMGWAKALNTLINSLYRGEIPEWDMSRVRASGAPLKTFGGRASGPEPLNELFKYLCAFLPSCAGRRLTSIEAFDIVCKIAEIVVVGGVRRSALICLSDLEDPLMANAKSGNWWDSNGQRALANISATYESKPTSMVFMNEWQSLVASMSGERGIFNREASQKISGNLNGRDASHEFGTNPCSEIILRSKQFCNLSEVVVRPEDTLETLERKVRVATILGTIQSTLIDFGFLSKSWIKNTAEERLLGVSMTGIMDNSLTNGSMGEGELSAALVKLKMVAEDTNIEFSKRLGIPASTAITCVKPSGTVSQLTDSASGIHARHNPFYVRTVRADAKDPLTQFMKESGFPWEPDITQPDSTVVFSFPVKVNEESVFRNDRTAIEQLELWKAYQIYWCQHKPSVTVYVKDDEWISVAAWCYENFDILSGVSFLPNDNGTYRQAPYTDCTEEEYQSMLESMPKDIDWSDLSKYESSDMTEGAQTLACSSGFCEV